MSVPYLTQIRKYKNNIYDTHDICNVHLRIILFFNYWLKGHAQSVDKKNEQVVIFVWVVEDLLYERRYKI